MIGSMEGNGQATSMQRRKGLHSITRKLARLLSSKARTPRSSDSSYSVGSDSSFSPIPSLQCSGIVRPKPSLTPLSRPLVSLLEVVGDSSFIPLLVYPLRTCFESHVKMAAVLELDGKSATQLAEIVQACLDLPSYSLGTSRPPLLGLLQVICSTHSLLPWRFSLEQVSFDAMHPIVNSPDTSIYKGTYQGQSVAVREIFLFGGTKWSSSTGKTTLKAVLHELVEHFQLKHRNLLRTLGIFLENNTIPLVVSVYMSYGSVIPWLKDHGTPETTTNILQGTADGLVYLHSQDPSVIHGNIHPNNILVNDEGEAVLCDFGIDRLRHATHGSHFPARAGGKWRYMAPELFTEAGVLHPTEACDIYALAMTFLTIVTRCLPFSEYDNGLCGPSALQKGMRPSKPEEMIALTKGQADSLWILLMSMWDHEPSARPRVTSVYDYLKWKLRPHRVSARSESPTGITLNSRTRTMSTTIRPQLSLNNGIVNSAEFPARFDKIHRRARVFSVPSTPRLDPLIE